MSIAMEGFRQIQNRSQVTATICFSHDETKFQVSSSVFKCLQVSTRGMVGSAWVGDLLEVGSG